MRLGSQKDGQERSLTIWMDGWRSRHGWYHWAMSTRSFLMSPFQAPVSKHATFPIEWVDALGMGASIKAGRAGRDPISLD